MGHPRPDLEEPPPDRQAGRTPHGQRSRQAHPLDVLKTLSAHHLLACLAMLIGAGLAFMSLLEEAALCALFSLACLHQAHMQAADREQRRMDELLFMVLRQLDEVRNRMR